MIRDRKYLDWLREQPCAVTGRHGTEGNDPAHVFKSVSGGGTGLKSSDKHALPLHPTEHAKQHGMSEIEYWRQAVVDNPILLKQMVAAYAEVYFYNVYQQEKKR